MKPPIFFQLLLLPALLALGCDSSSPSKDASPETKIVETIVLVTIDTWRRDATGFLGGLAPSPTPFLDQLARQGLIASDAVSPVPLTGPSHWSMLSGRWPWRDGLRINGDIPTRNESFPTLPEILKEQGWLTAGFVSCAVLSERYGFASGFDHFDEEFHQSGGVSDIKMAERRGDATVSAALSWIETQDTNAKIFLWIHLFDPHRPFVSAPGIFSDEPHGAYYAEILFADQQLALLSQRLTESGRPLEESLWVVLSDHGEALGEHGESSHGLLLHGATTRIPLIVAGQSVPQRRFKGLSSTVDVFPTLLGALNLDVPPRDGIDLLRSTGLDERAIPLESLMGMRGFGLSPAIGLRQKEWLWEASPVDHLWNLAADSMEKHDLGNTRIDKVRELTRLREEIGIPDTNLAQDHSPETIEQLRALGYIETTAPTAMEDVRVFAHEGAKWFDEITRNLTSKNYTQAEFYVQKSIERFPDSADLWINAGFTSVGLKNFNEAEKRFRRAIELNPSYSSQRLNLANVLLQLNRLDEAESEYRKVLHNDPENIQGLYNLGRLLIRQDRMEEGTPFWKKFQELAPSHPRAADVKRQLSEWQSQ